MNRSEMKQQLKLLLIDGLKLEGVTPEDIKDGAPIFVEGLDLDSIDALADFVLANHGAATAPQP